MAAFAQLTVDLAVGASRPQSVHLAQPLSRDLRSFCATKPLNVTHVNALHRVNRPAVRWALDSVEQDGLASHGGTEYNATKRNR